MEIRGRWWVQREHTPPYVPRGASLIQHCQSSGVGCLTTPRMHSEHAPSARPWGCILFRMSCAQSATIWARDTNDLCNRCPNLPYLTWIVHALAPYHQSRSRPGQSARFPCHPWAPPSETSISCATRSNTGAMSIEFDSYASKEEARLSTNGSHQAIPRRKLS